MKATWSVPTLGFTGRDISLTSPFKSLDMKVNSDFVIALSLDLLPVTVSACAVSVAVPR